MQVLRKHQYYFLSFVFLYTATGVGALVLANSWLAQSASGAPREAVISREIEQAGMFIGIGVAATSLVGYIGGISPLRRKDFLTGFVVLLMLAMLAELGLGGTIWFRSLRIRSLFQTLWVNSWSDSLKIAFQDMTTQTGFGQCCGYLANQNVVASGACATIPSTFPGCEEKVFSFADGYLRKLFTSLFGFTIVNVVVFVATIILIQTRNDEERYIRIGKKEGRTYSNVI
ncbi:phospholipid scramblase 1 [Dissophora globulifera]|nr:phospholipid scramblase 1 [Dissophora globulifera]